MWDLTTHTCNSSKVTELDPDANISMFGVEYLSLSIDISTYETFWINL